MKTLVICSGGLDSVTLAYKAAKERQLTRLVSFDYGQRHRKELECAALSAANLGVPHSLIDISSLGKHLSGSALTEDDIAVPDGHYAEGTMRITTVPNRNAIMLSIAFGLAATHGDDSVAAAFHSGDHFIYPDCRPDFVDSFERMQRHALDGYANVELYTPYVHLPKSKIAEEGAKLSVPFAKTWSCYKGGVLHCGRCGTCVERREAFALAGVSDPTPYEDPDFWKEAVKKREEHKNLSD